MDPRAFRVAQAFVQEQLRRARYAPEFQRWTEGRKFRNPDTGNQVLFVSLPVPEQTRIYKQWAMQRVAPPTAEPARPRTPEEVDHRNQEIAREGKVVASQVLSTGGEAAGLGYNQSFIVKLQHGDDEQIFIRKPAEGEQKHLRVGIPGGTYHAREQGAYDFDQLLGGRGVVPVTVSRGPADGSYQVWVQGARAMYDEDLNDLVRKVKPEDLHESQDFHRLNAIDLVMGHEDRHAGNLLYWFEEEEEEKPENLRFVAIDNGLIAATPSELPSHRAYYHPFKWMWTAEEGMSQQEQDEAANKARERGDKAVAKSLSRIAPDLHEQFKQVDLSDAARTMAGAGVTEEGAVRAMLVRLAALQENPEIFKEFLERSNGDLEEAWREFQYSSGQRDDLLRRAGAMERRDEIDKAVAAAEPEGGWTSPQVLENMFRELEKEQEGFDSWGIFAIEDAETKRAGDDAQTIRSVWWLKKPER